MTQSRSSQESAGYDPFALWRQFYEANEEAWTKAVKDIVTTPGYAEMQGKMLEAFLSYQKLLQDSVTAQMATLNIPTRDDIARLGELIIGMEEKIDRIEDRVAVIEDMQGKVGRIEVVDEKVSGLAEKVGRIEVVEEKVSGLAEKVDRIKVAPIGEKLDALAKDLGNLDERVRRQGKSLEGEIQAAARAEPSQAGERPQSGRSRASAK